MLKFFMTKHMYYLGLLFAVWVFFSQPVLAVRLVPGSVPTTTPLQPIPAGSVPNYSGNVNFQALPAPEAVDKPHENPQDSFKPTSPLKPEPVDLTSGHPSSGKIQLGLIVAGILGLLYVYVKFKKTLR